MSNRSPPARLARRLRLPALAVVLLSAIACARDDGSPTASEGPREDAGDAAQPFAGAVDDAVAAYYASLVERHDGDYDACGESQRSLPRQCEDVGDARGLAEGAPARILLMLDASGSMAARSGGERMLTIAQDALVDFSRRLPEQARVGFRVYGHAGDNSASGKAESCVGTELLYPFAAFDEAGFEQAVRSFEPVGWTPIAASLEAAAIDFAGAGSDGSRNIIYMVSDGIETCGGDPVAAARRLQAPDVRVVVNVIGFGVDDDDARQLRAIADAGGGEYLSASGRNDLYKIFNARADEAYTRYNCVSREQHAAYNDTSRDQHGRYNCLSRRAHGEYNDVSRDANRDYNDDRITREQRDHAIAQARRKRDEILDPALRERDSVLGDARRERDHTLSDERRDRDDRLDEARRERDEGLQR